MLFQVDDGEDHGLRLIAVVVAVAVIMLIPAFWNGYPLIYFDTEDYIDISFTWQPILWRIMTYAVFCLIAQPFEHLWPVIVVQGLFVAWMLHEAVFAFLPRWRGRIYFALGIVLAGLTGLPIVTSEVLADVFAGLAILGIATLSLGTPLPWLRRGLLVVLTAISIGVHMSHVAVACGLTLVLLGLILLAKLSSHFQPPRLSAVIIATAVGTAWVPFTHYEATGKAYFSEAGHVLQLALFIQDGLAKEYLDVACPEGVQLKLCAHKDELPQTADEFLWGESPFDDMGGWKAMHDESDKVILGTIQRFPVDVAAAMVRNTWTQLNLISDGEDLVPMTWHFVKAEIQHYPRDFRRFHFARQQRAQGIDFDPVNQIHIPVTVGAELSVFGFLILALRRRDRVLSSLIVVFVLAFLGNAFVCGALSNPHDRYQNRIVWLALFTAVVAAARLDMISPQRHHSD